MNDAPEHSGPIDSGPGGQPTQAPLGKGESDGSSSGYSANDLQAKDRPDNTGVHSAVKTDLYGEKEDNDLNQTEPVIQEKEDGAKQEYTGRLNSCFNGLARIGPLVLLAVLSCMVWPVFLEPAANVFCPAEIKSLTSFLHSVADNSWLAPTALNDGTWSIAQWPVFGWCIGLLALSPGLVESGYLLPATAFLCAFFAVLGVWCLAHTAGFGYRAAFASGLILLCTPLFAPLPHFMGPAALAAGFLLFALVFFCRGWGAGASWFSLPAAFTLTTLAGLTGGILHFAVPLAASFCYLIWRGDLRRAHKADAVFGYIVMLAIIGCWLGAIMLEHPNDAYLGLLFGSAWEFSWPIPLKWFLPVVAGILGTLPWILMIFGVSWFHVVAVSGSTLRASRHENSSALIWISLVLALSVALFIPWFHPAAIAIGCLVCVLLGKAFTNLGRVGNRFFCLLASICLIAAGLLLLAMSFESSQQFIFGLLSPLPVPDLGRRLLSLSMLPVVGGIVLLGGLGSLMFVRRFAGCGPLIYAILLVIIICQPVRLKLVNELAAMPATPLKSYAAVQAQVEAALNPPAVEPEGATQALTPPAVEAAPVPSAPDAPAYSVPPAPPDAENAEPLTSASPTPLPQTETERAPEQALQQQTQEAAPVQPSAAKSPVHTRVEGEETNPEVASPGQEEQAADPTEEKIKEEGAPQPQTAP